MSEPAKNLRQDLMLGLIYPAVLGSIFYSGLGELVNQVVAFWRFLFAGGAYDISLVVTVKFALLFVALAFYLCDYLYITFTNDYHGSFFLYDLVFVVTMYAAYSAIGLDGSERPPNAKVMLFLYFVFMALYYKWDKFELGRCKNESETELYKKVVNWERRSIVGIFICFLLIWVLEWFGLRESSLGSWLPGLFVAAIMTAVTVYFARYTKEKKEFSRRFPSESARPEKVQVEGTPNPAAQTDGSAAA